MTLVNLTGKTIAVMDETKKIRLCLRPDTENPVPICTFKRTVDRTITAEGEDIEIVRNLPASIRNLPAPQEGLAFVVNMNIAMCAKLLGGEQTRTDLLVPNDPVFDAAGRTVGYRNFQALN